VTSRTTWWAWLFRQAAEAAGVDPELLAGTDLPGGGLVGNSVDLMKVFAAISEGLGQASPGAPGGPVYSSLADLDAQIAEIDGDPTLHDKNDPRHAKVMLQRTLLFQQRYPEERPASPPPRDTSKEAIKKRKEIAKAASEELKGKSSPILPPSSRSGRHLGNSTYLRSRASVTVPGFRMARRAA
jgi:hypothetical protein